MLNIILTNAVNNSISVNFNDVSIITLQIYLLQLCEELSRDEGVSLLIASVIDTVSVFFFTMLPKEFKSTYTLSTFDQNNMVMGNKTRNYSVVLQR